MLLRIIPILAGLIVLTSYALADGLLPNINAGLHGPGHIIGLVR